jgi:septum formation protein
VTHASLPLRPRGRSLVLASTSPYRRALLEAAGIAHVALAPAFDESIAEAPAEPAARALAFARGKAESLRGHDALSADALVVGSDQVASIDGERLGKPKTVARAEAQLARLAGRTHFLHTAVALFDPITDRTEVRVAVHRMTMRPLDARAIAAYVAADAPLECAGSYKIEARGVTLFSAMTGDDHTGIVGLPISLLVDLLALAGAPLE